MVGRYSQLILVPGLLELRCSLLAMQWSLGKGGVPVDRWRDRLVFRSLQESVNRLAVAIGGDANESGSIGLVTHSFGDWVARSAIAQSKQHRVSTMVSLAPVMRSGFLTSLLYGLSGNLIPEIEVIMDRDKAAAHLDCDARIRRLVIWSRFDESVRSIDLGHLANVRVARVWGTHHSMVWQPNVIRLASAFLFEDAELGKL